MELHLLIQNLTNPTLLFFVLGIVASLVKSDLEIPKSSSKFIALYLLFAIGFKGGQELRHSTVDAEVIYTLLTGLFLSAAIPVYVFFILRKRLGASNAGAIAAAYGSVSAVTFVTAASFLETLKLNFGGHMVALMALMESPAIVTGIFLMKKFDQDSGDSMSMKKIVSHSFTNGSVMMILGSLLIGYFADAKQALDIKPFTNDIFKGFLAIFLLEMGMVTAKKFGIFKKYGLFVTSIAIIAPLVNGLAIAALSGLFIEDTANRFMLTILVASASYIAVPAAMQLAAPKADPGLFVPMSLGITFPFNITIGMPIYFAVIQYFS